MANQSVRLKEEQLRREEDKLREIEYRVQREIQLKRQELSAKEDSLKVLEARLGMCPIIARQVGWRSSWMKTGGDTMFERCEQCYEGIELM